MAKWPLCLPPTYTDVCLDFFNEFNEQFRAEHDDDLRAMQPLHLPVHLESNNVAQIYRNNKYRLTLSTMSFQNLLQYLEANERDGGSVIITLMQTFLDVKAVDRAASGPERSLAKLLSKPNDDQNVPAEDEGIPGHNPGKEL